MRLPFDRCKLPNDICRSPIDHVRSPHGFELFTFDHLRLVYGRCQLTYDRCKLPFPHQPSVFGNFIRKYAKKCVKDAHSIPRIAVV